MRLAPIPITNEPRPFTPNQLVLAGEDQGVAPYLLPVFLIAPTTQADHETLGFELYRHNIVPVSQDTFRALLLQECYDLFGEEKGEESAQLLDDSWQSEDLYQMLLQEYLEQERQRMADEQLGAPAREPGPPPKRTMSIRDRNRALLLAEDIRRQSRKVRDLTVEMQTYEPKQRAGIARITVAGWHNLSTPFQKVDGIIPEATWSALVDEIGPAAARELTTYCLSGGAISLREQGNSELLPETGQTADSSPEPTQGPVDSDGGSTSEAKTIPSTSTFSATQGDVSGNATPPPSTSTSPSDGMTDPAGSILPDAG